MAPDEPGLTEQAEADARHSTVWRAECVRRECRARHVGTESPDRCAVARWAAGHAHNGGRGGHVVAVWVRVHGRDRHRPMMIRYGDPADTETTWTWWGWVCLDPHRGQARPAWNEGRMTAEDAFAEWRAHECERNRR